MKSNYWKRGLLGAVAAAGVAFAAAGPGAMHAQSRDPGIAHLAFEVATVKPDDPNKMVMNELRVYPGGRLVIHGHSVRRLVQEAFDLPPWAVTGGEKWVDQQRFDVEGKPDEEMRGKIAGGEYSNIGLQDGRVRAMLQTLLLERFHLKFHMEEQEGTVYRLERGKGPLKLQALELKLYDKADDGTVSPSKSYPTGDMGMAGGAPVAIYQSSMHELATMLSYIQRAPVSDETGLTGYYNFKSATVVSDEDFKTAGGPMHLLVDALPEMGLRLAKGQGTVEKLVIDSIETPGAN